MSRDLRVARAFNRGPGQPTRPVDQRHPHSSLRLSVGSRAMTAPLPFNRSLEAGSGHPSISTAANPSTTKPL
ncbi:unnamed protein product [Pleuronectes platessa]|uniref:Uncharacterized protein n=1 Tax=Pleuronectes platessa TaxID=8262 RepID=A0A9N7W2C2_PLEPL|nr:unnamed protein product [Pleuronectes platessa]